MSCTKLIVRCDLLTCVVVQFLNGTHMPVDFDYMDPSVSYLINGRNDPTSQRFEVSPDYFISHRQFTR